MKVIQGRNVNVLYAQGLQLLDAQGIEQSSRAGNVKVMPCPVTSVYERPMERVLVDPVRDANPFFHLFESLWMLAGRSDAQSLNHYVKNFGERFAEHGVYIHGAYGERWRVAMGCDQLDVVVDKLRTNPDDRQAVIQMWDNVDHNDLTGTWKDRPCNTHIYLRVRDAVLDLTVCCRSNDVVWGAYGANAVHFSVLQEYLAGRIGVGVGRMYQVSNNYHGYMDVLGKFGDPTLISDRDPYKVNGWQPLPIGENWAKWDDDLHLFMTWHEDLWEADATTPPDGFYNSWFYSVAARMCFANYRRSTNMDAALAAVAGIEAPDWRHAAQEWLKRRVK